MRIVLLITIASLLSTATAAESNAQTGETAVSRVPRALILQPVMKVREEEDDGPFDWIANLFRGMTAPKRRVPIVPPMLGPIRVPGVNDEVYIKQLRSLSNTNSRVVVRVVNPQMSVPMAIPTPYYTYYQTPQFPISPTRQLPMSSSGFVPMSSSAPAAQWGRPQQSIQQYSFGGMKNNYQNAFNYSPPKYQNQHKWQASHQPFYKSPYFQQQNPYGTHDFDNSIQNSGRVANYISEPVRSTIHPYPQFNEQDTNGDVQDIKNQTIISDEVFDEGHDNEAKYSEESKVTSALASSSTNSYKEIYRPDRMAPTNPTWRNQFWLRKQKNTTGAALEKNHDHDHDEDVDQVSREKGKFSSMDMVQVAAPDLKGKSRRGSEEEASDMKRLNVDDEVGLSVKKIIDKTEPKEMEKRNFRPTVVTEKPKVQGRVTRRRNQWTPLSVVSTRNSANVQSKKLDDLAEAGRESTEKDENATPDVIKKVMSLTADNSWKNREIPKGVRNYGRNNDSVKNKNRRVRIVESVRSSVSMTSSKGEQVKSKSKS